MGWITIICSYYSAAWNYDRQVFCNHTTGFFPKQRVERKSKKARLLFIFSAWPTLASSPMDILILSLRKSLSLKVGMSFCLSLSLASLSTVEPEHGTEPMYLNPQYRRGCGSGSTFFEKLNPEPNLSEKRDSDPHWSQNSKDLEAQNRSLEGRGRSQWRPEGSQWSPGGSIDQWSRISIAL